MKMQGGKDVKNNRNVGWWALRATLALVWLLLIFGAGEIAYWHEVGRLDEQARGDLDIQALSLRGIAQRYKHIPYASAHEGNVEALLRSPTDMELVNKVDVYLDDVNRRVGSEALYLLNQNGGCIAASNWSDPKTFKGDTYHYRPYFLRARAGQLGVYYAVGSTTGMPGMYYASPVMVGDTIYGVMVIKVSLSELERSWASARDPVFLLDANGIVMLSSWMDHLYTTSRPLSPEDLQAIQFNRQYGTSPGGGPRSFEPAPWTQGTLLGSGRTTLRITHEGVERNLLVRQELLPEFDWTLMVTADLASASVWRWAAMALATALSLVVLLAYLLQLSQRNTRRDLVHRVRERTRELAEAIAFRKAMEDSLLVGMRARDLEGRVIYVNPALCNITGYSAEDLVGKLPPYPYWHPEELEKHWRDNEVGLSGGAAPTGFESRFRHAKGHDIFLMIYTAPLIDASGKHSGWMSSMVDVTPQKQAEDQLRKQAAMMQRTGRMASMGEMASTLAHELGSPLMSIASYAGAAKTYAEKGHQELLIETLGEISAQAQRAAEIVRRIRGFVRQHTEGFAECDVNEVVNNVLGLLRPELRHQRAKVKTDLAKGIPVILADRVLLEQVVLNLVMNAVQAMHERYPVDKIVRIETGQHGDTLYIRVLDRGPGIPDEVARQLFAPFFTTKPEGLGLGLNICRSTVEAHRGRLVFENRADGGAAFTVYLPLTP